MQIQQIRNATMRVTYAGKVLLTDPYLADKHSLPTYTGRSPNPLVDLPFPSQEVIAGVDAAIISHLHSDHFDPAAATQLSPNLKIFCQPNDDATLIEKGFRDVNPVEETLTWQGIKITRIKGQHGSGKVLELMGKTSGFIFEAENEPTLYWVGDTVWTEPVAEAIEHHQPDLIITHSCGAVWTAQQVLILMDAEQTIAVCRAAPNSVVIASHMEALDHATVSRAALRIYADKNGIGPERLLIPADGERLNLRKDGF
jgi:L-ascorbate metabolism protein UlaG (beta-lactamase superfamily)